MTDEVATVETTAAKVMSALRGRKYEKTNGSINCGDPVGQALAGVDHAALFEFAVSVGIDVAKYDHLNQGQKRMNVGNKLRTLVKKEQITVDQLAALPRAKVAEPAPTPAVEPEQQDA